MRVGGQDGHPEGLHEANELASNPAEADDSERPPRQGEAGIVRRVRASGPR